MTEAEEFVMHNEVEKVLNFARGAVCVYLLANYKDSFMADLFACWFMFDALVKITTLLRMCFKFK